MLKEYISPTSQALGPQEFPEDQEKKWVTKAQERVVGRSPPPKQTHLPP